MPQSTLPGAIRYAANLKWLFTELPFLDRFAAAAECGFKAVEFASPYEFPCAVIREALERAGLKLILINTPVAAPGERGENGYACIPDKQVEFREGVSKALCYAAELGCGNVHLMAGRCAASDNLELCEATFRGNLNWAIEAAKGTNVRFVLECLNQIDAPGYFLRDLESAARFIREHELAGIGLLFDVYHCQMSKQNVLAAYLAHEPLIQHIQFADVPGRHEPGTGTIAWAQLHETLTAHGYAGWVGCEYRPATSTIAGLGWRSVY